jgi:hypothetical protein
MAARTAYTKNLTVPGEVVASALQKAIRRGNEREALFWASELDLAGYGGYVWKRLRIIASRRRRPRRHGRRDRDPRAV